MVMLIALNFDLQKIARIQYLKVDCIATKKKFKETVSLDLQVSVFLIQT